MKYQPVVVLELPLSSPMALEPFVETCLQDEVELIAVWGQGCEQVEDDIDQLVVGDGGDDGRFVVTSSHPGEPLSEVLEFASGWKTKRPGEVQVIRL